MRRVYTADWRNNNENELISNINVASATPNCSPDNNSSAIIGLRRVLAIIAIIAIAKVYFPTHYITQFRPAWIIPGFVLGAKPRRLSGYVSSPPSSPCAPGCNKRLYSTARVCT